MITTPAAYFVGAVQYDGERGVLIGARSAQGEIALIVPTGNGRFGLYANLRTQGRFYQFMEYRYTGAQDPDTKDALIVIGVGFAF